MLSDKCLRVILFQFAIAMCEKNKENEFLWYNGVEFWRAITQELDNGLKRKFLGTS